MGASAQVTGSYSISGRDLRVLVALLQPVGGEVAAHAALLLRTLAGIAAHAGPASFFDFGDDSAGIIRHPPLRCACPKALRLELSFSDPLCVRVIRNCETPISYLQQCFHACCSDADLPVLQDARQRLFLCDVAEDRGGGIPPLQQPD